MWMRATGQPNDGYSVLQCGRAQNPIAQAPNLVSTNISASLVVDVRDAPASGQWYSDSIFAFNLSLTGRPPSARGRFEQMDGGFRPVGDLFFIPRGQRYHARGGPGSQRNLFVEMRPDAQMGDEGEFDLDASAVLQTCMNMPFDRLRDLLARMAREVRHPSFASRLLLEGLGITLLAETVRVLSRVEETSARRGGLSPWRLRAIEARAREGEGQPSLSELATLCGLSRRQLMRAFKEETGQTVSAFVQELTLERAKALLNKTDRPIGEVAAQVGFKTVSSFSTAFRRSTGESPRSFRASRGR